ncbi:MAG: hypothetical protein HY361_00270 [Candidatus Aenigmarchaeota archaeon]|nr:hypothetical protein [Candidatus Aenigmarchaeota archaeon]
MKVKSALLILVLFMLVGGFSIVPYVLQAAFYNPSIPQKTEVPDSKVVDGELTPQQENAILQQGKVIIRFEYNLTCEKCLETQNILGQLVNLKQFENQIFVEEIKSTSSNLPKVNIIGFVTDSNQIRVGEKTLQGMNVTETEIINSLCGLMLQPPVECALRNV